MGNCSSSLETIPIPGIDGNLDESSKELLLKALSSKENGVETIRTLIASNVDVNHKLEYESIGSCYPLHIASKLGNVNAVGLLIEGGADNTLTDSKGRTPLHWAVEEEHLDIVDRLLEAGADVNVFDEDEITPLHLAIKTNNEGLVQKLIDAGADISPEKGENPLITSVKGEHIKVILPLLKDPQPEESPPRSPTSEVKATTPGPDATSPEPATSLEPTASREPTPGLREPTISREATPAVLEEPSAPPEYESDKETSPAPEKEPSPASEKEPSPAPEKEPSPTPESEKEESQIPKDTSDNEEDKKTTDV